MTDWRYFSKPVIPSDAKIGDCIEDESGWWQVEGFTDDGEAILVGRDGEEIVVSYKD